MSVDYTYAEADRMLRKARRAQRRGKAIERLVVELLTQIIGALLGGVLLMWAVGFLHAEWWSQLPTMGYWTAAVTVALLRGVFSRIPTAKETES